MQPNPRNVLLENHHQENPKIRAVLATCCQLAILVIVMLIQTELKANDAHQFAFITLLVISFYAYMATIFLPSHAAKATYTAQICCIASAIEALMLFYFPDHFELIAYCVVAMLMVACVGAWLFNKTFLGPYSCKTIAADQLENFSGA